MADDPMDEVVGRVRDGIEAAVVQAFANGAPEFAPRDFDALCYGATRGSDIGNTVEGFHQFGQLRVADLRALLAAYQSVREENARMREVLQNLADDDGYCDFVSIARDAIFRTGGTE